MGCGRKVMAAEGGSVTTEVVDTWSYYRRWRKCWWQCVVKYVEGRKYGLEE